MRVSQRRTARESLTECADSLQSVIPRQLASNALTPEALENFRAYVAILREWDQKRRSD